MRNWWRPCGLDAKLDKCARDVCRLAVADRCFASSYSFSREHFRGISLALRTGAQRLLDPHDQESCVSVWFFQSALSCGGWLVFEREFLAAWGFAAAPSGTTSPSPQKIHLASKGAYRPSQPAIQSATNSGSSGPGWVLASSPNAFTPNDLVDGVLSDVTCLSPTDCFAVGNFTNGYGDMTLIEHWNGTLWLTMPSPNLLSLQDNILSGVTCTSSTQCFAVGAYTNQTANGNF